MGKVKGMKKFKKNQTYIENSQGPTNDKEKYQNDESVVCEDTVNTYHSKRTHSDSESDHRNTPKKKKKKKQQEVIEAPDKKNKKSIRQMKREKFAQRQADMQAAAKEQTKSECLQYLYQWKNNRQNWKFMKAKQVWLYKNKFSESMVPNDYWSLLLDYFESAKGNIRNMLLTDANKIIKQMDNWIENQDDCKAENNEVNPDSDNIKDSEKPSDIVYKRARELIQFLQE